MISSSSEASCLVIKLTHDLIPLPIDASGRCDVRHAQALALVHAQKDKISKLEVVYKSELANRIKLERDLQEKSSKLEALLDTKQA
ncbi:unnamed protein product [Malus baccata var. baccata]